MLIDLCPFAFILQTAVTISRHSGIDSPSVGARRYEDNRMDSLQSRLIEPRETPKSGKTNEIRDEGPTSDNGTGNRR